MQTRPPEAHEVTGPRAIAPVPVGLPGAIVQDHLLPGDQETGRLPATIRERCPSPPQRRCGEAEGCQAGNDRATALEQAAAEEHPQEVEKAQIDPKRHRRNDTRQKVIHVVSRARGRAANLQHAPDHRVPLSGQSSRQNA